MRRSAVDHALQVTPNGPLQFDGRVSRLTGTLRIRKGFIANSRHLSYVRFFLVGTLEAAAIRQSFEIVSIHNELLPAKYRTLPSGPQTNDRELFFKLSTGSELPHSFRNNGVTTRSNAQLPRLSYKLQVFFTTNLTSSTKGMQPCCEVDVDVVPSIQSIGEVGEKAEKLVASIKRGGFRSPAGNIQVRTVLQRSPNQVLLSLSCLNRSLTAVSQVEIGLDETIRLEDRGRVLFEASHRIASAKSGSAVYWPPRKSNFGWESTQLALDTTGLLDNVPVSGSTVIWEGKRIVFEHTVSVDLATGAGMTSPHFSSSVKRLSPRPTSPTCPSQAPHIEPLDLPQSIISNGNTQALRSASFRIGNNHVLVANQTRSSSLVRSHTHVVIPEMSRLRSAQLMDESMGLHLPSSPESIMARYRNELQVHRSSCPLTPPQDAASSTLPATVAAESPRSISDFYEDDSSDLLVGPDADTPPTNLSFVVPMVGATTTTTMLGQRNSPTMVVEQQQRRQQVLLSHHNVVTNNRVLAVGHLPRVPLLTQQDTNGAYLVRRRVALSTPPAGPQENSPGAPQDYQSDI